MKTKIEVYNGNCEIVASDGKVSVIDDNRNQRDIGKIERIELSIENPEEMIGISRVEQIVLYDQNNRFLYNDQEIVNNMEYHSEKELMQAIAKHYCVSEDIIEII